MKVFGVARKDDCWLASVIERLASTWLMLLSGFVDLGYFAYRGTKKRIDAIGAA